MDDHGALLAHDEPAPFTLFNPDGGAPLLIVCDHASRRVPRALDRLGLDDEALSRHIAWDIGAAEVARRLSSRFDAPCVHSEYSRLVIDMNRALDDPTSIPIVSDDVFVPGNRDLTVEDAELRARTLFHPYHQTIAALLDRLRLRGAVPAVVSIHSFTPEMGGRTRPWHVGVLWDSDGRIAVPLLNRLRAEPGLQVGDNEPYSGRDPEGYTVRTHAAGAGLPHVVIELRQDLIADDPGAARWSETLARALENILADHGLHGIGAASS